MNVSTNLSTSVSTGKQSSEPTLGVVAISKNEERDLPYFLENLLPWVDEIIIIDDGSTDATPTIAENGGEKVKFVMSPRKEGEYFSGQRNKGIDLATSDWLLHMDIDERIPPALAEEMRKAIRQPDKDAYSFQRLNFYLHRRRKGNGFMPWKLRLAKRELFRFGGKMHETDICDVPAERRGQLNTPTWHLNDESYSERLRKSAFYSEIEAENILESGLKVKWHHFLVIPIYRALHVYFLRQGFRDGTLGLLQAIHSFASSFQWYALAWEIQNHIPRQQIESEMQQLWSRDV